MKIKIIIIRLLIIACFIILWQLLSDFNIINSFVFSSPMKICNTIVSLYKTSSLFNHITITVLETLYSFSITTIISFIFATLLYEFKTFSKIIDPFLTVLNSLPKVALGPIIIIIFGANQKSIIIMAILISLIVSIQSIHNGFLHTNINKIKLLDSFGATRINKLVYLVIPSNIKTIISTCKINISMCLIGVIMGEFLTSKAGIGYLILYGSQMFNMSLVYAGVILLLIISAIMYYIILAISNHYD